MRSSYRRTTLDGQPLHPDTQMVSFGYDPALSEGAVKPPVFLTSTFAFRSAEEGAEFFDVVAGRKPAPEGMGAGGLVYSRFNHPNTEIVEDRLALYDGAESALLTASGMAAIGAVMLTYLRPGDALVHYTPLYGGTETLIGKVLPGWGIRPVALHRRRDRGAAAPCARGSGAARAGEDGLPGDAGEPDERDDRPGAGARHGRRLGEGLRPDAARRLRQHHARTCLPDAARARRRHLRLLADEIRRRPFRPDRRGHHRHQGAAEAGAPDAQRLRLPARPAFLLDAVALDGDAVAAHGAGGRKRAQGRRLAGGERNSTLRRAASGVRRRPGVAAIYARQCTGPGSTFAFVVENDRALSFRILNALELFKLAVSLGGTELLVCHPASTTHSGVPQAVRDAAGVTEGLIRLSVGMEHPDDLIRDLAQAFRRARIAPGEVARGRVLATVSDMPLANSRIVARTPCTSSHGRIKQEVSRARKGVRTAAPVRRGPPRDRLQIRATGQGRHSAPGRVPAGRSAG